MYGMTTVILPIAILLIVVLVRNIPKIGGSVKWGLLICSLLALIMGGIYNPITYFQAFILGLDKLAWVIALAIVGSIYAETQIRIGTMATVLDSFRARFGRSPKGLVVCIIIVLTISGSLLGESIASATIIGILVIKALDELDMKPEQITATIVMGACIGSIMPPISQATFLASSLLGMENMDPAINLTYITIGIGMILVCLYVAYGFVKVKNIPLHLIPEKKASVIMRENWRSLVPLTILALIIILRTGFKIDLLLLVDPIFKHIRNIPVIKGFDNAIVKAMIIVTIISFLYKEVRSDMKNCALTGCKNVVNSVSVQLLAAFMVGAFYTAGQVDIVQEFTLSLSSNQLKIGGALAMCLIGMISGSQTTTQTVVFTFFGPALVLAGVPEANAAIVGGHLAMAGQGMPPADVVTFVVAGIVSSILNKKVDPVKSMGYSFFMCAYFIIVSFIFMYI